MDWVEAISTLSKQDKGYVIVTILSVAGSSPRNASTKMVVDSHEIHGTIGGGNLEHTSIAKARKMLTTGEISILRESVTLGSDLTQCCGGSVELLFECIPAKKFNIVVFGAGHVGSALMTILSQLPCKVSWVDSREERICALRQAYMSTNIQLSVMTNPDEDVGHCARNAYYLVMTHSHELDMQLVEAILSRQDILFCGLIGSKSKAAKFKNRLARKQFTANEIKRLTSPIGLKQVSGKSPMEVAVSVAGQLIHLHHKNHATSKNAISKNNSDLSLPSENVVDIRD